MKIFTFKALFLFLFFGGTLLNAQTPITILDFETPAKSAVFGYFGSSLMGTTAIINNPNPTGINTSAKVSDFKKAANSEVWAGAGPNPADPFTIDATNGGKITIKVHRSQIGKIGIKLEHATNGTPDWINVVSNTVVNQWQELTVDLANPSVEGAQKPAAGGIFKNLVIFFDFGDVLTAERTYYFDDVIFKPNAASNVKTTFQVDMSKYTAPFKKVFVAGTFNDFTTTKDSLSDPDGDKVYTGQISMPTGIQNFTYFVDSLPKKEAFLGTEQCAKYDDKAKFITRLFSAIKDSVLPKVCFASCYACGEGVKITFNLGTSNITPSATGVYIAGGGNFGNPGDNKLLDPDGDKIYSIVFERPKGFTSDYTFTNGNCADFSCKENIKGQSCAVAPYDDRRIAKGITKDTTISTCFSICTDAANACAKPDSVDVTFRVDMRKDTGKAAIKVYLSGGLINNWSANANQMLSPTNNKIYETTVKLQKGIAYQYKFQLNEWQRSEEFTDKDAACTFLDGNFRNRIVTPTAAGALTTFCFGTCSVCAGVSATQEANFVNDLFSFNPTLADDAVTVSLNADYRDNKTINVFNAVGQSVYINQTQSGVVQQTIATKALPNGLYIISVKSGTALQTHKMVVNH